MAVSSKLLLEEVSFSYGDRLILDRFSLQVSRGEFVSLIGPSGVGKSTLFRLASGLAEPERGRILLDGAEQPTLLGKVGLMPQSDLLLPWRTVVQNAALPLELQKVPKFQAQQLVRSRLPQFGLEEWADAYPDQLSGGMRQRVSLLRATLTGNELLLLDEPFSALDGITRMEIQEWLLALWQQLGHTILLITHDLEEAILLADRVLVLSQAPLREAVSVPVPLERGRRSRYDSRFQAFRRDLEAMLRDRTGSLKTGERNVHG